MQIQISWLLQKPTDLDLHCFHRQGISWFSRTRVNTNFTLIFFPLAVQKMGLKHQQQTYTTLSMLGKNFNRWYSEIFFSYFSQKIWFVISCKLLRNQFTWNGKPYFLGKINIYHKFAISRICPESARSYTSRQKDVRNHPEANDYCRGDHYHHFSVHSFDIMR